MAPSEKVLHRAASRLVGSLIEKQLLDPRETPEQLEKRVLAALQKNFKEEAEIELEANRILAENRQTSAGMDQRMLLNKIRQKVARDRGFVL